MEVKLIIAALSLGLASGFHCLGMCGPIALSLGLSKEKQLNFYLKNLTYQLGRIITYSFLGLILGMVGEGFSLAGVQSVLTIFSGILLILMALLSFKNLNFESYVPFFSGFLQKVKIKLGYLIGKTGYSSRFLTGILNGFLPCGMVYMALTASLACGSIWQSGFFMILFGLGTLPFMFLAVLFGNMLTTSIRNSFLKIIPFMMIVLGCLFVLRGLEVGIPYISPNKKALKVYKVKPGEKLKTQPMCH